MRYPPDFLDEIRARLPISTVVGQRVAFDAKKSNPSRGDFWGCCPFHGEKTPSFHCVDPKGRYHCFGCGRSGDVFRFICELDGVSFPESIERLADQAGLKLPERDLESEKRQKTKANLYDVMEMAAQFFSQQLNVEQGRSARLYLDQRALELKTRQHFRLGFAPNSHNALKDALTAKNISLEQMEACGLIASSEDKTSTYDRFRNRIMYPIEDLRGRIVAFGGRALDKNARAKYLNSPETVLFHKGDILYNARNARQACQSQNGTASRALIVVEGYMDVIALYQAGFPTALAPLGTALGEAQILLLWRMNHDPIFCFDGDQAGIHAAFRTAERIFPLLKAGVSARFVLLPQGKDPDDIVKQGGANAFQAELDKAISLAELLWFRYTSLGQFQTPEERAGLERTLKQAIFKIKDESLRHYYLQDMRERLRQFFRPAYQNNFAYKNTYKASLHRHKTQFAPMQNGNHSSLAKSNLVRAPSERIPLREGAILMTLATHPDLWHEDFETLAKLKLDNRDLITFHRSMLEIMGEWQPDDAQAMRLLLEQKGQGKIFNQIHALLHKSGMRSAFEDAPIEDAREALKQAIYLHFRAYNLNERLRDIETQLMENPQSDIFVLLRDIKQELEQAEATQALIEGFGR
ncbi:DNA primase [Bartonella tamiae]|uniref:DNA primase n=1 Tax=Bartonella tamiae Th239 TaxID=1094558 RepID=J0R0U8_9HYPH|nr:DNA primase [Bartonella tamiae]EJF89154.1 DNA primase [Bartonella tamiae Th239]EJF95443.1 DNA primase [Bartonella tamiae Th307]